mmetsp:Transcript_6737/g.15634  ORF Transcript_6737/g.15634 Transcript_6737/m.15634 type:complete len:217 (-) Transcript_6737:15-665(-)
MASSWLERGSWDIGHLVRDDSGELSMLRTCTRAHFAPGPKLTALPPPRRPDLPVGEGLSSDPEQDAPEWTFSGSPTLSSFPETAMTQGKGMDKTSSPGLQSVATDYPATEASEEDDDDIGLWDDMESSFDAMAWKQLPAEVARAPDRRTHDAYLRRLKRGLKDLGCNPQLFKFKVLRKRGRDFPDDFFQRVRHAALFSASADGQNALKQAARTRSN